MVAHYNSNKKSLIELALKRYLLHATMISLIESATYARFNTFFSRVTCILLHNS